MAAHVWTAQRKSQGKNSAEAEKQTSRWGTHLVHHLWEGRKDLAMPAEVKEVSVWWNGSICCVPSLSFLPISFFFFFFFLQRTVALHSFAFCLCHDEWSRHQSPHLLASHCCSVQSPCVHGDMMLTSSSSVRVRVSKRIGKLMWGLIFDCIMRRGCPSRGKMLHTLWWVYCHDVSERH